MPTLPPLKPPQCRHIWQSHGASGLYHNTNDSRRLEIPGTSKGSTGALVSCQGLRRHMAWHGVLLKRSKQDQGLQTLAMWKPGDAKKRLKNTTQDLNDRTQTTRNTTQTYRNTTRLCAPPETTTNNTTQTINKTTQALNFLAQHWCFYSMRFGIPGVPFVTPAYRFRI